MISDEPDEDADSLDDEALAEAFTGTVLPPLAHPGTAPVAADWPACSSREENFVIDSEVLAWFQAHHPDWEKRISSVLRAWIATRPHTPPPRSPG